MLTMVPAAPADQAFLDQVYASTQRDDLADQYYTRQCPHAERCILLCLGHRAGAAILCRRPHEIRLMDLAILPAFRNLGIGTALIRALQAEAATTRRRLTLQVKRTNRARRLYERLGFVRTGETPTHLSMVWRPGAEQGRQG